MGEATGIAIGQESNRGMATRVLEKGTKIDIHIGDIIIPGTLNDSETSRAFCARLPLSLQMGNSGMDFCGRLPEALPLDETQVHNGWLNGDIDFATDGNWLAIFYAGEERSEAYGYQVNMGKIDCELSRLANLQGSHRVYIELAEG